MLQEYYLLGKFRFFKNYVHKDINLHKKSAVYSKPTGRCKVYNHRKGFFLKRKCHLFSCICSSRFLFIHIATAIVFRRIMITEQDCEFRCRYVDI